MPPDGDDVEDSVSVFFGISLCLQNIFSEGLDQALPMTFKTSAHEPTKCQWKVIPFSYAFEDVRYCVCQILLRDIISYVYEDVSHSFLVLEHMFLNPFARC